MYLQSRKLFSFLFRKNNGPDDNARAITQAEQALRESEEKYKTLVDMSPDAIVIHSEGRIVFVNKTCLEMVGATSDTELIGKPVINFVHPDYRALAMQRIKDLYTHSVKADLTYEKFIKPDGEVIDVETTAIPFEFEGKPSIQLIVRDVSKRIRMEEAKIESDITIKKSEAQYRLLADNMNDLVWLMDLQLNTIYISPSVEKLQGLTLHEIQQIPLNERITPESYRKLMAFYIKEKPIVLSNPENAYHNTIDLEFYDKSGATFWLEINFSVIYNELSQEFSVLCVGRDITIHKKMSEKLMESEEKLNLFFSQSLDGFFIMELDEPVVWNEFTDKEAANDYVMNHQKVIKTNQAMLNQYNATEDQIMGKSPADFFAHDPEQGRKVVRAILDNNHLHIDTLEKKTDGTDIIIEGDYICMYDKENRVTGTFGIQRDVTVTRKAESALKAQLEELRRWQMVTLGREDRNMELKREVNELLNRLGEPLRYPGQQIFDSDT